MKAFHNDPAVKEKYLARVRAHAAADELIRGVYWDGQKGCAVGCTIHSGEHAAYETELGIPRWLARLEDRLFEGMSVEASMKWPERFLDAIPVGADLQKAIVPFMIIVVERARTRFDHKKYPNELKAIDDVLAVLRKGGSEKELTATAAVAAAVAVAAYAAGPAAADAAYAAVAAADAAYAAAAYADGVVYATAAGRSEYEYFAEELLKLLRACGACGTTQPFTITELA